MSFVLDLEAVVPHQVKSAPGVTVYVKPCTLAEIGDLATLPSPEFATERDLATVAAKYDRHIDHIAGLAIRLRPGAPVPAGMRGEERDGRFTVEVRSYRDAMAVCPAWLLGALAQTVHEVSNLSPAQLGESTRPSSGGESTAAASTAPTVDDED